MAICALEGKRQTSENKIELAVHMKEISKYPKSTCYLFIALCH